VRFRPRPAELVLLLFAGYCLVRAGLGGTLSVDTHAVPRGDIFIALLFVLTVRLGLDYRDLEWPTAPASQRRRHALLLVVFVLAGVLPGIVVFIALPRYLPSPSHRDGGAVTSLVLFGYACVRDALAFLVPGPFLWLATGLYIKRHGRFTLRGFFVDGAPAAFDVLRDWAPPLALVYCYLALGPIISQRLFPDRDASLAAIDRLLFFGRDPTKLCERLIWPPLSEWLSGCYVFYGPLYPLVLGCLFAQRERAPFREAAFALSVVLAVGYVGYAMVPAVGPLFLEKFERSVELYYTGWLKAQLMDRTRVPRDCFPSLHTAVSLTLLWVTSRHLPRLAWVLAPIVLSIPFACVYLRYHYVTDVIAGVLLFGAVATWTSKSRGLQAAFRG
jgi:membrane-associated phospholipid phosphatase